MTTYVDHDMSRLALHRQGITSVLFILDDDGISMWPYDLMWRTEMKGVDTGRRRNGIFATQFSLQEFDYCSNYSTVIY